MSHGTSASRHFMTAGGNRKNDGVDQACPHIWRWKFQLNVMDARLVRASE
ncbi:MAG: hypothetical protein KDB01_18820 [Planctomycetaceae bacterium]|nr:hypothetical protein [Planctomycetaceae bacterium]